MEVSAFFSRLLRPPGLNRGRSKLNILPDDLEAFDKAWTSVQAVLLEPDEGQLLRGIHSTDVPHHLEWLVNALVHESDAEETGSSTGGCLEYFLNNGVLQHLVKLSEADRPFGIRAETLHAINVLLLLLPDSFLVHSAVHRPLLRLIRSSISLDTASKVDGIERVVGAAGVDFNKLNGKEDSDKVTEGRLVDLLSILCAKVRAYPLLLLILFHDRLSSYDPTRLEPTNSSLTDSSRNASPVHLDYLIFSYLLRYVHYDGRIGECARVGAGGLFDIAFGIGKITNDEENQEEGNTALNEARVSLAEQIFDGNAADVLAAGLGAVYSVLPFKVRLPTAEEANKIMDGGMHLGLNPDSRDDGSTQHHLRSFQDKDIQHQLDLITEICRFIDSIISKCRKAATDASKLDDRIKAIASALVDQVRTSLKLSFLDNVLYPSILECSIVDGSATAVVSYLRVILCSDPPASPRGELSTQVLAYLLGLEELGPVKLLVTKESRTRYGHLTARFTLKDLFMDAIASDASEAGIAALNLFSELLDRFCGLSTPGLLTCIDDEAATAFSQDLLVSSHKISAPVEGEYGRVNRVVLQTEDVESMDNLTNIASGLAITPDASPYKPSPSLVRDPDVELYSGLVLRLRGPRDDKESAAAQVYLTDAYASVCRHDCFQTGLSAVDMPHSIGSRGAIKSSRGRQMVGAYRLDPADVVLQELLNSLRHFFSHTAEFNVSLTGVLSSLAKCPCRSLRGWLLRLPKTESAADSTPRAPPQDVFTDSNPFQDDGEDRLPILYQTLRELTKQIAVYRSRVPDFNLLLTERRRGLLYVEGMEEALEVKLDVVRTQTVAPGWTPQREGVAMSDSSPPSLRRRTSNLSASLVSFLTPRKKASSGPTESISGSPFSFLTRHEQSAPATPFAAHYQRTTTLALEPLSAGEPISGMWTPDRNPPSHDRSISLTESISDSVGWNPRAADGSPRQVTLSQILDNCVVLEEFIKETIGHITARHTLGIDGRR